ncbi:hypothetical protein HRI_004489700 [Hibiscus trionum]|uniref:Disease resistance N-terminal domain-containing protein n=1 Tax=Hibiscus trionum TaxID=183268 RepID=A0A9W7J6E2_HIBTR|nr:hypothetical protein HRI_004489700 [Hibiscus trionum]
MELSNSLDPITSKVISVLENEASLLTDVGAEIDETKLELKAIKAFLEDAEKRFGEVPRYETDNQWAYEVEDVMDEYMYHFNKQQKWRGKPSRFFVEAYSFSQQFVAQASSCCQVTRYQQKDQKHCREKPWIPSFLARIRKIR